MPYQVLWSASALDRVTEFLDFIAEENPGAARRVILELFERVQVLGEQPRLGRRLSEGIDSNLRRLVAGKYVVVYQIQDPQQTVTVIAIRHSREKLLPEEGG